MERELNNDLCLKLISYKTRNKINNYLKTQDQLIGSGPGIDEA